MDEIKLLKWMVNFQSEIKKMCIEYDSFFLEKRLADTYELQLNSLNEEFILIVQDDVPQEIKNRFVQIFAETKPEDSI